MAWREIGANHDLVMGRRYRISFVLAAPYSAAIAGALEAALRWGRGVAGAALERLSSIKIERVEVIPPDSNHVSGRAPTWAVRVTFRKVSEGTFIVAIVSVLSLIVVGVVGWSIVAKTYEEEFVEPTVELAQGLVPVGILAVLGLFVFGRG